MATKTKAEATYEALAEKCRDNPADKGAMADKAKAFEEVRNQQREQARRGDGHLQPSKRSLQDDYIRRFPEEARGDIAKRVFGK